MDKEGSYMKKGFTLVELIVSFALISTIALLMFEVVNVGMTMYNKTIVRSDLTILQSQISYELNTNFRKNKLEKAVSCGYLCLNFSYVDSTKSDMLKIDKNNNKIILNDEEYKLPSNTIISLAYGDVSYLDTDKPLDAVANIYIGITNNTLKENYDINVVYLFDSSIYTKLNSIKFTSTVTYSGTLSSSYLTKAGITDKSTISSLTFYDDGRKFDGAAIDVSEDANGKILLYKETNPDDSTLTDLYIVGDVTIYLPTNSSNLFAITKHIKIDYDAYFETKLTSIRFNDAVDTSI